MRLLACICKTSKVSSGILLLDHDVDEANRSCTSCERIVEYHFFFAFEHRCLTTYERPPNGDYGTNGYIYSRIQNPTRTLLEEYLSELEHIQSNSYQSTQNTTFTKTKKNSDTGSQYCTTYSSGMAAVSSIILAQEPNVHMLVPDDVYHGIPSQLVSVLTTQHGISYSSHDMTSISTLYQTLSKILNTTNKKFNSVIVWLESPSNPLAKVSDIQGICDMVKSLTHTIPITVVVDSTWAPPCITQPLLVCYIYIYSFSFLFCDFG